MTVAEIIIAGRYRLGPSLGVGGMGQVWLARDEMLDRDVAIKQVALPFGLSDGEREEIRLRTLREAQAAGRLNHPNVVRVYDVIQSESQPWIVMEYVRSRSLMQILEEFGPLPVDEVAGIGLAVLSALDAASRAGVLHRDVKPSNVLIADDGRVVLTDFGSAIMDEAEGAITRTGVILGSPQFISPERACNGVSAPESDLWSLGATLYAAVEGRAPYTRPTAMATLIALATKRPDPMHLAGPLKPVINGLLQKDPAARMSATEVERRLRLIADVQTAGERPEPAAAAPGSAAGSAAGAAVAPPVPIARANGHPAVARLVPKRPLLPGRLWQKVAASAIAVLVIPIVVMALRPDRSNRPATASPATLPQAATQVDTAAAPPKRPGPDLDALPAGMSWWHDTVGFRVAVPAGWLHVREGPAAMLFCEPGGPKTLRVREWDRSGQDPISALIRDEDQAKLPGYRRIRLETLPGDRGAEWEYVFDGPMGRLHGLDRAFLVLGRAYVIQWRTPPGTWSAFLPTFAGITNSFKPPHRLPVVAE